MHFGKHCVTVSIYTLNKNELQINTRTQRKTLRP